MNTKLWFVMLAAVFLQPLLRSAFPRLDAFERILIGSIIALSLVGGAVKIGVVKN